MEPAAEAIMPEGKLTRAETEVLKYLRNLARHVRGQKKTIFRAYDRTIGKNTRYAPRTVRKARSGLRKRGLLEWRQTGRAMIYEVAAIADIDLNVILCQPEQQQMPGRAAIGASRIKGILKEGNKGKNIKEPMETSGESTAAPSYFPVRAGKREPWEEAKEDFEDKKCSSIHGDVKGFVAEYGLEAFVAELERRRGVFAEDLYVDIPQGCLVCQSETEPAEDLLEVRI